MLKAWFKPYRLTFRQPVLTSRNRMEVKNGYYFFISDGVVTGIGECSYIEGLSPDDLANYEGALRRLSQHTATGATEFPPDINPFPSIRFGWESAMADLKNGGRRILFESEFTAGKKSIPINGLVWMGSKEFILEQITRKIGEGFNCIKLKVGALDFDVEMELLSFIRSTFPTDVMEIRVDANGAFKEAEVFNKLEALSKYGIHSIEQPVQPGQWELMKRVCAESPIPVALDEELFYPTTASPVELLSTLRPRYIILKPSLLGGVGQCNNWINLAESNKIGWWVTSALESNIGLNTIAQWTYVQNNPMVQGLGTGELYSDNIPSPLYSSKGRLHYDPDKQWGKVELER